MKSAETFIRINNRLLFRGGLSIAILFIMVFSGLKIWITVEANSVADNDVKFSKQTKQNHFWLSLNLINILFANKTTLSGPWKFLKSEEALPVLEGLFTGEECNHDSALCQYELKKAIQKIKGDFWGT